MAGRGDKSVCRSTVLLGLVAIIGFYTSYHLLILSNDVFDANGQDLESGDSLILGKRHSALQGGFEGGIEKRKAKHSRGDETSSTSSSTGTTTATTTTATTTTPTTTPTTAAMTTPTTTTTVTTSSTTSPTTTATTTATTTTHSSTSPSSTVSSSSSSPATSTTTQPTTPEFVLPPKGPCFNRLYYIGEVCEVRGSEHENVTFQEITSHLFLRDVLELIAGQCDPGAWCLTTESRSVRKLEGRENRYLEYCPYQECLLQMPDECIDEERRMVLSTLSLLCEASRINTTDDCLLSIREMTHVTMSDIIKAYDPRHTDTCVTEEQYDNCSGSCRETAQHLHCMCATCVGHDTGLFEQFAQWQWFFSSNDTLQQCGVNATTLDCSVPIPIGYKDRFLNAVKQIDVKLVLAVAGALVSTIMGITITICACVRKRKNLEYKRDRVGYAEVAAMDIDVDEDFET